MGEIADMMCEGILDEWTGEYIGPAVGYPRSLDPEHPSNKNTARYNYNYGNNPLGGIQKWIIANTEIRRPSKTWRCIERYYTEVLKMEEHKHADLKFKAAIIAHHHWVPFMKWVKETYK